MITTPEKLPGLLDHLAEHRANQRRMGIELLPSNILEWPLRPAWAARRVAPVTWRSTRRIDEQLVNEGAAKLMMRLGWRRIEGGNDGKESA